MLNSLINSNSNHTFKISNYADDTVIITINSKVLNIFSDAPGLKINLEKSNLYSLGSLFLNPPRYFTEFHF